MLAYVLAVTASLVVALTVVPALALMLLRNEPLGRGSSRLVRWSDRLFITTVPRFVRRPGWAYATMVLLLVVACAAVPQLQGRSLFASPHDRTLVIHVATVSGTSLPEMERITNKLSQELRSVRGVRQVGSHVGRAVTGDQVVNVNSGEMWVSLADSASYDVTAAAVRRVLDGYPGVRSDLLSYPEDRVRAAQARTKEGLVVRLYGQDLRVLRSKAEEIRTRLSTVQGVVRPRVQAQAEEPTLVVELTDQGRALVDAAVAAGSVSEAQLVSVLDPEEADTLSQLLRKLLLAAESPSGEDTPAAGRPSDPAR